MLPTILILEQEVGGEVTCAKAVTHSSFNLPLICFICLICPHLPQMLPLIQIVAKNIVLDVANTQVK